MIFFLSFFEFLFKRCPRGVQELSRASQERPKSARERPKSARERPKSGPRAPRRVPRRLSRRSGEPLGTILTLLSSKKERSESDPSRDALEKRFRDDFQQFSSRARKGRESSDMRSDS